MIFALTLALSFAETVAPTPPPPIPVEVVVPAPKPVVVFIHGLYLQAASWSSWEAWFQAQGWDTIAADWPLHAGVPAELRAKPPEGLRDLDLSRVVDHYRQIIRALPEKPLIVGHSMGGLVAQLLLAEGLGRAGVAIHPAPPQGVSSLRSDFVRANGPLLFGRSPRILSDDEYLWGFANHQADEAAALAEYDRSIVPESRLAGRGPTTKAAKIDFDAPHPPLMFIAGTEDHTIPGRVVHRVFERYAAGDPASVTSYWAMAGRTHATCQAPGWEEVAEASWRFGDRFKPTERPADPAVAASVVAVVEASRDALSACHAREAKRAPGLAGRVDVRFSLTDGLPTGLTVTHNTAAAGLGPCVEAVAKAWTFPGVTGLEVRIPLDLPLPGPTLP